MPATIEQLLAAIVQDDRATAERLLKLEPSLCRCAVKKDRLYQAEIYHWIYSGDTPLHVAAAGHRLQLVQLLLAAGADPNESGNRRGCSPLHYAADGYINGPAWNEGRQVKTIRCLLKAGAGINGADRNGATPLHRAVRTRCSAAVRCLLYAGADPLLRNKSGSTPFHLAVQNTGRGGSGSLAARTAQRQIVEELLAYGVSVWLKDGRGKTVWESAQSVWLRDLLVQAGTQSNGHSQTPI